VILGVVEKDEYMIKSKMQVVAQEVAPHVFMRSPDSRHHCCSHTFSRSLMPGHRRLPIHATSAEQQEADVQHERLQRGQKEKDTRLHKAPSPESMARTASCRVIHHVKCLERKVRELVLLDNCGRNRPQQQISVKSRA